MRPIKTPIRRFFSGLALTLSIGMLQSLPGGKPIATATVPPHFICDILHAELHENLGREGQGSEGVFSQQRHLLQQAVKF